MKASIRLSISAVVQRATRLAGRLALMAGLLLLLAACRASDPSPAGGSPVAVAPPLADFYAANGGERILGHPLTEAFTQSGDGRLTQFFERLQLIYDPASGEIAVALLGEWALAGLAELSPAPIAPGQAARLFPETGQSLQDAFLAFYESEPGAKLLGPPISPQLDEGGLRVQYFRNGRLEWRPDAPPDRRVEVGKLARAFFYSSGLAQQYEAQIRARPVDLVGLSQAVVTATVQRPFLYQGDEQILYVRVTAPDGRPVPDAAVEVSVQQAEVTADPVSLGQTDAAGRLRGALPLAEHIPGQVVTVLVTVRGPDGSAIGEAQARFQTWW